MSEYLMANGSRFITEPLPPGIVPLWSGDWTNLYIHSRRRHAIVYPGWRTYRRIKRKCVLRRAHGGRWKRGRG